MHAASNLDELQVIAKEIKAANLSTEASAALKDIYGKRQKDLKAAPASEPKAGG
jgi:hypothetical protein